MSFSFMDLLNEGVLDPLLGSANPLGTSEADPESVEAAQELIEEGVGAWRDLEPPTAQDLYLDPNDLTPYETGTPMPDSPMLGYGAPSSRGVGTPPPGAANVPGAPVNTPVSVGAPSAINPATGPGPNRPTVGSATGPTSEGAFDPTAAMLDPLRAEHAEELSQVPIVPVEQSAGGAGGGLGPGPSAFEGLDSAWEGRESAYNGLGPSAYTNLEFSPEALERMGQSADYFSELMGAEEDPIMAAHIARERSETERRARGQREAALRNLAERGQGGVGDRLLAELDAAQTTAEGGYLTGLEGAAMAAARRDSAANLGAGIAEAMGRGELDADTARAGGIDEFDLTSARGKDLFTEAQAGGLDEFGLTQAGGLDTFTNADWDRWLEANQFDIRNINAVNAANTERDWKVDDQNTGLWNDALVYNQTEVPMTVFDSEAQRAGGLSGAATGGADFYGNLWGTRNDQLNRNRARFGSAAGTIIGGSLAGPAGATAGSQAGGGAGPRFRGG